MSYITPIILTLLSIAFAGLRIGGMIHPRFQAFAHLFVGGLFVAWWTTRKLPPTPDDTVINGSRFWEWMTTSRTYLVLALALSFVELSCFLWFKFVSGH